MALVARKESKNNRHGENEGRIHKCPDCGREYTRHNPKKVHTTSDKTPFRFPNEWTEEELLAHKISHIKAPRVRRILGKVFRLTDEELKQLKDFLGN